MTEYSDVELAQLIKSSDHNAFYLVYERYSEPLFHYLWSRTGNTDQAKEILQEVFIRLWEYRARLNTHTTLKPLLYRIANNAVIDQQRKNRVRLLFRKDKQESTSPVETAENPEKRTQINIALQKVPEKLRTVFILHHIKEYRYEEIAEICQVSKKTVEKRMKKAILMLQKLLMSLF